MSKSKRRQAARQADLRHTALLGSAQMSANRTCRSFAAAASPFSLNQPRGKLKRKLMIKKLPLYSGTPPYGFPGNTVISLYGRFFSARQIGHAFLPPQGFRPEGEIPRRHSSNSRYDSRYDPKTFIL